jgi:hypothetical protein
MARPHLQPGVGSAKSQVKSQAVMLEPQHLQKPPIPASTSSAWAAHPKTERASWVVKAAR